MDELSKKETFYFPFPQDPNETGLSVFFFSQKIIRV